MNLIPLNQNELEALRILWERGDLKPGEVQAHFSWPIENATLRSILLNLVEKGHITRKLRGKAYYYAARVPKATLLQAMVQGMARIFSGGSTRELVAQLVDTGDIKPADVKLIRQVATAPPRARKKSP